MQKNSSGRVLQFGAFELKTDTGEMRKHGTKIRLQGKPLHVLQALLERPGEIVSREELRDKLWAADTFVDFESGLNTAVNRLRLALGDSADHPRYVETLARNGYRFMAPVSENTGAVSNESEAPLAPVVPPENHAPPQLQIQTPIEVRQPSSFKGWLAAGAAAGLLAVAGFVLIMRLQPPPQPAFHQITFRRTTIRAARFGPDGQSVIYEARKLPGDRELYMANTMSPESRALGFPQSMLAAVSPSGELALVTFEGAKGRRLVRVPLNGGAPLPLDRGVWAADWAPDGSRMAVIRYGMHPATIEYPRGKKLFETTGWLTDVRVSPSGSEVAFIEHPVMGDDAGSIIMVDAKGVRQTLSSGWASAAGLAWAPGGREVWFTATRSGLTRALYAVNFSGKLRLIAAFPGTLTLFDISPSGRVLIAREQIHASMAGVTEGNPKEQDLSWFDYTNVEDISADGSVVLFSETGEGGGVHHAVYVRRTGSSNAVRVGDGFAMAISADGNWVVTRPDRDPTSLNLVPLMPGQSRILPGHGLKYDFVRFFPAGDRLLVVGAQSGGAPRLFTQALNGSAPVPIRSNVYMPHPAISEDGTQIAGIDAEQRLVVQSLSGGEPKVVTPGFAPTVLAWSRSGKTLIAQSDGVPAMLYRIDLDTGKYKLWKELAPYDLSGVSNMWPASLSRDERTVVYTYLRDLSELFVVDGWK